MISASFSDRKTKILRLASVASLFIVLAFLITITANAGHMHGAGSVPHSWYGQHGYHGHKYKHAYKHGHKHAYKHYKKYHHRPHRFRHYRHHHDPYYYNHAYKHYHDYAPKHYGYYEPYCEKKRVKVYTGFGRPKTVYRKICYDRYGDPYLGHSYSLKHRRSYSFH